MIKTPTIVSMSIDPKLKHSIQDDDAVIIAECRSFEIAQHISAAINNTLNDQQRAVLNALVPWLRDGTIATFRKEGVGVGTIHADGSMTYPDDHTVRKRATLTDVHHIEINPGIVFRTDDIDATAVKLSCVGGMIVIIDPCITSAHAILNAKRRMTLTNIKSVHFNLDDQIASVEHRGVLNFRDGTAVHFDASRYHEVCDLIGWKIERCGSCRFRSDSGHCRRFPPVLMPIQDHNAIVPHIDWQWHFPFIADDWWCGEFQAVPS